MNSLRINVATLTAICSIIIMINASSLVFAQTPSAQYSATVWAWDSSNSNGWISEPIIMDGSLTNFSTPHTFADLTGTHSFTLPKTDQDGNALSSWNTGETSVTLTFSSEGIYTARYAPLLNVLISPNAWAMDLGQSKCFTAITTGGSGNYTSYQWYVDGIAQQHATSPTFNYTPATNSSYLITVTVTDSLGTTSQAPPTVVTVNSPQATPQQNPVNTPTNKPINSPTDTLTPTSSNSPQTAENSMQITLAIIIAALATIIPTAIFIVRKKRGSHYEVNRGTGEITFGDDENGENPPLPDNHINASYKKSRKRRKK
jgi:hypothetical protein